MPVQGSLATASPTQPIPAPLSPAKPSPDRSSSAQPSPTQPRLANGHAAQSSTAQANHAQLSQAELVLRFCPLQQTDSSVVEAVYLALTQTFLPAPSLKTSSAVSRSFACPADSPDLRWLDAFATPLFDDGAMYYHGAETTADRLCDHIKFGSAQVRSHG